MGILMSTNVHLNGEAKSQFVCRYHSPTTDARSERTYFVVEVSSGGYSHCNLFLDREQVLAMIAKCQASLQDADLIEHPVDATEDAAQRQEWSNGQKMTLADIQGTSAEKIVVHDVLAPEDEDYLDMGGPEML